MGPTRGIDSYSAEIADVDVDWAGSGPAPRSFSKDEELLTGVLRKVITASEGPGAVELLDAAVALGQAARAGDTGAADRLAALVAELDLDRAEVLVRSLTRWFQLVNLAEDNDRVRRLRNGDVRGAPAPRPRSLRDAISELSRHGVGAAELNRLLADAELRLVMTAHPTEARRRTTIEKLARVFKILRTLDENNYADLDTARDQLLATVQELWGSDELRAISLTVRDEVRGGLVPFATTLAETVPRIYRDLERALSARYPSEHFKIPAFLRFGSWIGGDRDGNPFVTPGSTLEALDLMREQCLRFLEGRVALLAGRLSLSVRVNGPALGIEPILTAGEEHFPEAAAQLSERNPEEPYRRALTFIRERVAATATQSDGSYRDPKELLEDLHLVERSLRDGAGAFAAAGDLLDVIRQVEVFGFHFADLDIREHARAHTSALAEIYRMLDICDSYETLPEIARRVLLAGHIAGQRPLIPTDVTELSPATQRTIEVFHMIRAALAGPHRGAIRRYIVSHTERGSDLLEVLLLMKEAGLAQTGGEGALLRILPLFETGASLAAAADTMDSLLSEPVYRSALRATGDEQEIMIGYSDSNKDVGYVASGWACYEAQTEIVKVLEAHGASWSFFHGRGGAVGRGGGPTYTAIRALPPHTVNGRLQMTEQGEVLSAKYSVPEIAHRELELAAAATLLASVLVRDDRHGLYEGVMGEMAETSKAVYRSLVHDDPDFARFFTAVTPLQEISRLRLGSRPARRGGEAGIDNLRAIPWVFSWTQSRVVLPAWLGLGAALASARERHGLELLREMTASWPFFSTLLENAEMALAKADADIAERYAALWDEREARERIWELLRAEFEQACRELMLIRGSGRLLDSEPALQTSIDRRNPFVDPLSFIQVELLRRLREGEQDPADRGQLGRVSLLTINGIASGLRNTG